MLGGLFVFADPALKHYDSITGRELLSARFAASEPVAALPEDALTQARRKFRVISGGLDQS